MAQKRIVGKLKQARGIAMREKILETAELYFCEKGYLSATTRNLAEAAGISVGSFYFYFKDKEELLLEVYRNQSRRFLTTVGTALEKTDLYRSDRYAWLRSYIDSLLAAYGNSGKLRAELKAVTWKNPQIAAEKKLVKQQTVGALTEILAASPVLKDTRVKHPDIALLLVIDIMDATYERIASGVFPEEREAVVEECTDALYRYLFMEC